MEKLLELLNQYTKEEKKSDIIWELDNDGDICSKYKESVDYNDCVYYAKIPVLISKSYGFIKRLVDNDKIDKYKVIELEHNGIRPFKLDNLYGEIKLEERLLMLLSIQDNPISFLISVLK